MINRCSLICLAFLHCAYCFAGTIDPRVPDSKYLEYGAEHECVVPIYGNCECDKGPSKPHMFAASAVVIGKRWIVTAAHVVDKTTEVKIKARGREYEIPRIVVNNHYREELMGKYDIAIGESKEDIELDFYPKLYEEKNETGKIVGICGYGMTGTFSTGAVRSDNKKRAGSNTVDHIERHVMVCSATRGVRTELEFMIARGDSGGGLFIDGKLAGVNSFVMAEDKRSDSDYGDECCHTRVSIFSHWILGYMNGEEPDGEARD